MANEFQDLLQQGSQDLLALAGQTVYIFQSQSGTWRPVHGIYTPNSDGLIVELGGAMHTLAARLDLPRSEYEKIRVGVTLVKDTAGIVYLVAGMQGSPDDPLIHIQLTIK